MSEARTVADPDTLKWAFGKLKPETPHVFAPATEAMKDAPCRHCGATKYDGAGHWRHA